MKPKGDKEGRNMKETRVNYFRNQWKFTKVAQWWKIWKFGGSVWGLKRGGKVGF